MVKLLGIVGSPRTDSNTEYFIQKALSFAKSMGVKTDMISLNRMRVEPCTACYYCIKNHNCCLEDDFNQCLKKIREADCIFIGTPVFFSSITPQLSAFFSRAGFVSRASGGLFEGKVGGAITVARKSGNNMALSQILLWLFLNNIYICGSTFGNIVVTDAKGDYENYYPTELLTNLEEYVSKLIHTSALTKQAKR